MNDRVLVKHEGNGWIEAVVVALWSKVPNSTSKAPYLVKLNTLTTDNTLQVASDSTALIRKLQTNALDNVLFAIKCGDDAVEVEQLANQYQLDFSLVSRRMLLETAIVGNISVAEWLLMTFHKCEDYSRNVIVDDKGRNLVHLSIHHKQYNYLLDLIVNPWKSGDNENFEKINYWGGYYSLPVAVDGSGNNILHYAVLTGDARFLAHILKMRVQSRHYSGVQELCAEYDDGAAHEGNVIGLDRRANGADKTPRDLASLRGRKDMIELFDNFHKRVVITYIGKNITDCSFSGDNAIEKSREFIKKCKLLLKVFTISPAQYLQEDLTLNRAFYCGLIDSVRCSDLFVWIMKEFKVFLRPDDRTRIYDNIINGCITTLMSTRPFTYKVEYHTKEEEKKIKTRRRGIDSFADLFTNWSKEPVLTEDQLLSDAWVEHIQNKWKDKKNFPTYDAVEYVRTVVVEKWGKKAPDYCSDNLDHLMAHEMLSKMDGDPERLATLRYAVRKGIIARPPLHVYVVKGELHMLQWHCDVNKCDLRLPLSSSEETVSFLSTYEPIKLLTGSDIDAGEVTVAEALCAVAVCQGEFPVFQFLMLEKVDNKGFFVNGMNMLHLAAVNYSLLMVKWLVFHEYIPVDARINNATGANALHLLCLHHSRGSIIDYLEEELPGAIDSEGHDYNWYRRAKLKRDRPDVDWDGLDLVMSQLREVTRLVEEGDDFCEARSLLEDGILGEYLRDERTWNDYYSTREGKHRLDPHYIKRGEDELECDDNSFVDWFFKFIKRAIKLNRGACLQWLVSLYRRMYLAEKAAIGYAGYDVVGRLATLIKYATCVNQPTVTALLQAEVLVMTEEDERRRKILQETSECLKSAFVCGVTVEEILDHFAAMTRLLGTLTLTVGDSLGLTMDKLISCDKDYDCKFLFQEKWGPSDRGGCQYSWPLEVVVWEGHLHLVKWLLELQQLHKHIEVLLKAIEFAACRPDASIEMLPLLLSKLQMIEEQRDTLDSPPDRNVIVRELMMAILVSCGSGHLNMNAEQGNTNLSAAKLLLPVLQSYGVNVNAYLSSDEDSGYQYGNEHKSILMMNVKNLLLHDTAAGWDLLRWVMQLPELRHDSEVALDTSEKLPLHKEWRQNNLFSYVGKCSYRPDTYYGWFVDRDNVRVPMEVDEIKDRVAHSIRVIDFLLKFSGRDVMPAIGELVEAIKKELDRDQGYDEDPIEDHEVAALRHLAEHWGVDVRNFTAQSTHHQFLRHATAPKVEDALDLLVRQQRERWFVVEALESNDAPLRRLQTCEDLPDILGTTYEDKCTLLHVAAKHGCTEVITWLMENHVDAIDAGAKDIAGRAALSFAHKAGFTAAERAVQKLRAMQIIRRFLRQAAMRLQCVKMAGLRSSACTLIQKAVRRYLVS